MAEHGHEEEIIEGEDEQARRFHKAVMFERGRHAGKGFDASHDREHGIDHLLMWAQRYQAQGKHEKAGSLIQAAREQVADLYADLNDARASGVVHTYGEVQRRLYGVIRTSADREPQPGDGPDYHADHAAWVARTHSGDAS